MSDAPVGLRLDSVTKWYDGKPVVESLHLDVPAGCTTVLIGPSGCGKSTLLRLMIGLIRPDSGSVYCGSERLGEDNLLHWRRRMGYVIQEGGLFPHLSARANASLMARYLGWTTRQIEDRLAELAKLTHFPPDGFDRFPAQLSGGQRQRVSLMRALMLDPDVLLLDEPLGALDPMIRSGLQSELRDIFDRLHKTVVLVTHDIGEAAFFGDPIVLIREGSVVQSGNIQQLADSPADPFVTRFIRAQRPPFEPSGGEAQQ